MVKTLSFSQVKLIKDAEKRHGDITPCGEKNGFTYEKGWIFWYDTADKSTHIVREDIKYKIPCKKGDPNCNAMHNYSPETQKKVCDYCLNHEKIEL